MLSRLYRKAEALDDACLRAWGHPRDHSVREELLSALEWDSALHPEHARPKIRELFVEIHDQSVDLQIRLRASSDTAEGLQAALAQEIQGLRQRLSDLMQVLDARRGESR